MPSINEQKVRLVMSLANGQYTRLDMINRGIGPEILDSLILAGRIRESMGVIVKPSLYYYNNQWMERIEVTRLTGLQKSCLGNRKRKYTVNGVTNWRKVTEPKCTNAESGKMGSNKRHGARLRCTNYEETGCNNKAEHRVMNGYLCDRCFEHYGRWEFIFGLLNKFCGKMRKKRRVYG